jgi:hypothetical protein
MANGLPDPSAIAAADLDDPNRMLDAIDGVQTVRPNRNALRTMFGEINAEAKAIEVIEAKLEKSLQRPKVKPSALSPSL